MPSATRDWSEAPYVRVYVTLGQDHPIVWRDLELLGAYVRLLVGADRAWPGLAEVPAGLAPSILARLEADEVIDVEAGFYRFHGLDSERNGRTRAAVLGGRARAATAVRDDHGRFVPAEDDPAGPPLDAPSVNGSHPAGGETLVQPPLATSRPATRHDTSASKRSSRDIPRAHASAPARETPAPSPNQIRCSSYAEHRAEHRWWPGIGWRCQICERARTDADNDAGLTFSEKVRRASSTNDPWGGSDE